MDNVTGRPWKNIARFSVFEDADNKRSELIKIWETNNTQGMQVKVRRNNSPPGFVVKTRVHPDFEPKQEKKKSGKSTKRNKKNSDRGKFDASSSV